MVMATTAQVTTTTKVIDGDGHIIERDAELFEYLRPPYQGNNALLSFPFFPTLDGYQRGAILARTGIFKDHSIDAPAWVDFLDEVGIESTVLYPTAGLAFGCIQDPEWAVALARAYNNWLDELQMVGVVLTGNSADMGTRKLLGDPAFWPFYEEAERLNCAVAVHGAVSMNIGLAAFNGFAPVQALEHPFAQMIQLTSMMFEGVFERFPRLRVAFLDACTSWVPFKMDRLHRSYRALSGRARREYCELLQRPPSEYVKAGNFFFSC